MNALKAMEYYTPVLVHALELLGDRKETESGRRLLRDLGLMLLREILVNALATLM